MKSQGAKNGYNEKPKDVKRIALSFVETTGEKISIRLRRVFIGDEYGDGSERE